MSAEHHFPLKLQWFYTHLSPWVQWAWVRTPHCFLGREIYRPKQVPLETAGLSALPVGLVEISVQGSIQLDRSVLLQPPGLTAAPFSE